MKIKFISYWNKKDDEGDREVCFSIIPAIVFQYYHSDYGSTKVLFIHWLLWEIEIDFNPYAKN